MEETKTAYGVLVWKTERKRSFQRPRDRRHNSIKMDHQEIGREGDD